MKYFSYNKNKQDEQKAAKRKTGRRFHFRGY